MAISPSARRQSASPLPPRAFSPPLSLHSSSASRAHSLHSSVCRPRPDFAPFPSLAPHWTHRRPRPRTSATLLFHRHPRPSRSHPAPPSTVSLRALAAALAVSVLPHLPHSRVHPSLPPSPSASSVLTSNYYRNIHHSHSPVRIRVTTAPSKFAHVTPPNAPLRSVSLIPRKTDGMPHVVFKSAVLLAIAMAVVTFITVSVFWIIQDSLVYKPTKVWRGNPAASGMPHFDDVHFTTPDGAELTGWFIRQPPGRVSRARTLIYFHGTDKNASFRLKKVIGFYELCNCNILLLSYRGYGRSTGKPNERGVSIDAESAYHYLASRGDIDVGPGGNLWVYGESLGGAVAIYFTKTFQHCVNALILENTFTSLLDMIKVEFPILGVFRYLSRNRWQSKKRIPHLSIPLLFLSGLADSYIPPVMMKQMHNLATKSPLKEFVEFEKGTHNRTWTMDGFYEAVAHFMDRVDHEARGDMLLQAAQPTTASPGIDETGRFATAS